MGVLYYARYFELLELGRTEWQRDEGLRYADMETEAGLMLPVVKANCQYRTPLKFDDLAIIETTVSAWSATTISFASKVLLGNDDGTERLCAEGEVSLGCIRKDNWRPHKLPNNYRDLLEEKFESKQGRH